MLSPVSHRLVERVARMPAVWRLRALQALARWGIREETLLIIMAGFIGLAAGAAVWVFEKALHFIDEHYYSALAQRFHATSIPNVWLLPLLPAVGGLAVVAVRWVFRQDYSRLHGISSILYALIRKAGTLRHTLGLESLLTSCLTIGTGGSAGPEAPIAVIGSSVGSIIGSAAGISRRNIPTLIGCGAAGGISAIFGAPISGVLFAMEVLLRDFSVRTFTPIVISSVISTVMYQTITGEIGSGLFASPVDRAYHFTFAEMPYYLVLGIVCGCLAVGFTRVLGFVEKLFDRQKRRLRRGFHPAVGAAISGICGVILILVFSKDLYLGGPGGQFAQSYVPIFADGYPTIHRALDPQWYSGYELASGQTALLTLGFLAAVCLLKIVATAFTIGSGGSGGVFAPSLFIGATGGGAVGLVLQRFNHNLHPSAYALVGMGAVLAAAIQAPLMAIMLLFELTRNYQIMLPAMLAAVTATLIQQIFVKDGLYTLPLRHEGIRVGSPVGVSHLRRIGIDQLGLQPPHIASANDAVTALVQRAQQDGAGDFIVFDARGRYLGLLPLDDLRTVMLSPDAIPVLLTGDILRTDIPPLSAADTLETAFETFSRYEVDSLPVFSSSPGTTATLVGVLLRSDLLRRYHAELSG